MKKGYVQFKDDEYIVMDKQGRYVVDIRSKGCFVTKIPTALTRTEVVIFTTEEAIKFLRKNMNLHVVKTTELCVTYGIEYGESGNYDRSPLNLAIIAYNELTRYEKARFFRALGYSLEG